MSNDPRQTDVALGVVELRRRALLRLVDRFRLAKWVMAPLLFSVGGWILYIDGAPWRWALVAVAGGISAAVGVRFGFGNAKGIARFCERDFRPSEAVPFATVQVLLLAASGGLASPLLPIMFAGAHNAGLFGGPAASRSVFVVHVVGLWTLLALHLTHVVELVPHPLVDTHWPGPTFLTSIAVGMTGALIGAHVMGLRTREAVDEQLRQAVLAREAALGNYRERADELTTLSAEIAHELKNPLATVKGLAALLGRDAEGKSAERLLVLRREVDRMQGILDEFLNFSRPLAPLTVRRVDLGKLAREVIDLHEGIASDRRVAMELDADLGVGAVCDPRKIKQILVNLLQNALDAAGPETTVEIVVRRVVDLVEIQLLDRGAGVPADLSERVFEAGMTTKPNGNGLGLPMARALARQHGGDLRLAPRGDGHGCAAIVQLPVLGPALANADAEASISDVAPPPKPAVEPHAARTRDDAAVPLAEGALGAMT